MKEKIPLKQSDFRLTQLGTRYCYIFNQDIRIDSAYGNWPFHKKIRERNKFLKSLGIEESLGAFPLLKTKEEALFLLVLSIANYNERNGLTESI